MSSAELTDWFAFFKIEPFGPWAMNLNVGSTNALLYNIHRGKKQMAVTPERMSLGEYESVKKKQSVEEQKGAVERIFSMLGGKRKRRTE